jgi:hypothetical protein
MPPKPRVPSRTSGCSAEVWVDVMAGSNVGGSPHLRKVAGMLAGKIVLGPCITIELPANEL